MSAILVWVMLTGQLTLGSGILSQESCLKELAELKNLSPPGTYGFCMVVVTCTFCAGTVTK